MNEFLQTALTFPTVVYSVLLAVSVAYWLLASTGLADADFADGLAGADGDLDGPGGLAAMLSRLGLGGMPLMVVGTLLSLTAWLGTYFVHLLVLRDLPDGVRTTAGAGTLLVMLVLGVGATAVLLAPVRHTLSRLRQPETQPSLLGRTGVVITPTLAADYGQVSVDDGGAGLILQVRHDGPSPIQRGDRVVLIDYIDEQNAYTVMPEQQFLGR